MDFEELKCDNCLLKAEPWSEKRHGLVVHGCPRCGEDLVAGEQDLRNHDEFQSDEDSSREKSLDEKMRQAGL